MDEITRNTQNPEGEASAGNAAELAVKKLEGERAANKDPSAQAIIAYLISRAKESESLARDILNDRKNYKGCWNYIYKMASKAPRTGNCVCVNDEAVFEWAEDYFRAEETETPAPEKPKPKEKPKSAAKQKAKPVEKPKEKPKEKPGETPKDMPVSEAEVKDVGNGQKLARETLYFRTGDIYWKVDKGSRLPTEDSLKDAERITKAEYYKVMKPADMVLPEAEPAAEPKAEVKAEVKQKAGAKPRTEKKPAKKPKNEMDGQLSLFDMFGG